MVVMILMLTMIVIITMMIHDGDVQVIVMTDGPHDARNEGNHGNDFEQC